MSLTLAQQYFQLIYVSQAIDDLTYNDLSSILGRSRENNAKDGITGLLIHRDGFFIQFLEGKSESLVKKALSRIIQDPRHHTLRVVAEWNHNVRYFDKWSMAFHDSDICEVHPFIQKIFSDTMLLTLPTRLDFTQFFEDFSQRTDLK